MMKIFICLDDGDGMMFNHRRQSRDIRVIEDIVNSVGNRGLMMNRYSESLFEGIAFGADMLCEDTFLDKASEDTCCFVESERLAPYKEQIEEITIYRWNKMYPSDMKFDINLNEWTLKEVSEFMGKSHEKITREVYVK